MKGRHRPGEKAHETKIKPEGCAQRKGGKAQDQERTGRKGKGERRESKDERAEGGKEQWLGD